MKILSLNTWQERGPWKDRWEIIIQGIEVLRPDVIAFQEVFNAEWAQTVTCRTGFKFSVFPKESSGLFLLSRYPIRNWHQHTYQAKSPTEDYYRYALWAHLSIGGHDLHIFNTHLSWRIPESQIRRAQAAEMAAWMNEKSAGGSALACGDFNTSIDSGDLEVLLKDGWIDSFGTANPGARKITWDNQNPYARGASVMLPDRRIDHVFYRNPGHVLGPLLSSSIVLNEPNENGVFASDHYGVMSVFRGD